MILVDATPLQTEHRFRGIGTYTSGLLEALADLSCPVPLGLLAQRARTDDLPLLSSLLARSNVRRIPLYRPRRPHYHLQWLTSLLSIRAALQWVHPRVYHATEPNGLVLGSGIATVATLYDLIPLRHPAAHFSVRQFDQRVGYARYLHLLQRADHLVAISEASKYDAVERLRIPSDRVTVTYLAVDEQRFYPRSREQIMASLTRYGLRQPYFLHVGASTYAKNTANVLRAFELFSRRSGSEHGLFIVGKWTARALTDLHTLYPRLIAAGRLRVLGFVPEEALPALYGGADALIYPSLYEGFGLPVLEAMRCATPVLTSNTSSLPEVGGEAVLYVDPHRVEEIEAALHRLAGQPDLRAELVVRGLQQATKFNWTRTAEQTRRVYEEFL